MPVTATGELAASGNSAKRTSWLRKKTPGEQPTTPADARQTEFTRPFQSYLPYGICLSGGGIRAASFSLGALERFQKEEMLVGEKAARYLSCVSGGSYTGTAFTMLSRGAFPVEESEDQRPKAESPDPSLPAYAQGSPEVGFLRDNTKYLTHGWGGLPVALWRLVLGILWNFVLFIMGVLLFAIPVGWLYGWRLDSLRVNPAAGASAHALVFPSWIFWVAIGLSGAGVLAGFVWIGALWTSARTRQALALISLVALGVAVAWLLLIVVAPIVLEWIRDSFETSRGPSATAGVGSSTTAAAAAGGSTLALSILTAVFGVRAVRTADSWWKQIPEADQKKVLHSLWHWILRHRAAALNLLAWLLLPATVLAVAVFGMELGALYVPGLAPGSDAWVAPLAFGAGVFLLGFVWCFADLTAWSLHPFYRERLSNAFVLKRFKADRATWSPTAVNDGDNDVDSCPRPYDTVYKLSDAQPDDTPELVVCASANVSKHGATPTGSNVCSFVFSWSLIGGRIVGGRAAQEYEQALRAVPLWARTITAPGAMAMSGAAVSPEMGRMTRPALRFLLTMANIRLGVWVPNPNRLHEFQARADHRVRRLRLRPRLGYLLREMFGRDDPDNMFLYVTDGGHYENLGLVELVRRGCKYIWCIDASGDQQGTFSTLAGALRLAKSELGIDIDIDPTVMAPVPATTKARAALGLPAVVNQTYCEGQIMYPDGPGRLVVVKAGVPANAPFDIADFHKSNPVFPCDSTADQLYDADRFDAYRELGYLCADQAVQACGGDFDAFRQTGDVPVAATQPETTVQKK
jgi:hypothetical protein